MKNVYMVEAVETIRITRQYRVEANTMEQAKEIILEGDRFNSADCFDWWETDSISIDGVKTINHLGVVEDKYAEV